MYSLASTGTNLEVHDYVSLNFKCDLFYWQWSI